MRFIRILGPTVPLLLAVITSSCSSVFPSPSAVTESEASGTVGPLVRQEVSGMALPAGERVDIWLIADPLHTGVIFPLDWLDESGFEVPAKVRGAKYVNLSWGDRVAYEEERWLTPGEVVHALFMPSDSVLEIIPFNYDPRWVFPEQRLYRSSVSRGCGPAVANFLNYCRRPGSDGWVEIASSTWGRGSLLDCQHNYQYPRLCNSFTAGALSNCGYSFGTWGRITANAMIRQACRQGFEPIPDLTQEEKDSITLYQETGKVNYDAP
jgi:hypothetical protein